MSNLPLTIPDLVGLDDVDSFMSETTSDLQTLLQDVYHILIQLLGSNLDDMTKGCGIDTYLNGTLTQLAQLGPIIETQLTADTRITRATANIQTQSGPYPYVINISIEVAGQVIGLQYGWSQPGGLTPL